MSLKSTKTSYGRVAVTIHWLSVLLILAMIGTGQTAASMNDSATKASVLTIHIPLGITVLLVTLGRLAWWLFVDTKPAPPQGDPAWQTGSAKMVHVMFYVVILGMAASGIGMMVMSGAGPILFEGAGGALPNFQDYLPRTPHGIGARLLLLLILLHLGAALYHQLIKKDGVIGRMWFGKPN